MGSILSGNRSNAGIEQLEYGDNNAYKYPPKGGSYFGSHFFMGGERFEASQPEAFLFGENTDLNFLGSRPYPFPYHVTVGSEPSKALRGFINIRKDSLKLVKIHTDEAEDEECPKTIYSLEFIIDADLPCNISIHMFAREELNCGVLRYVTSDRNFSSPVYHCPAGYKQVFRKEDFLISPTDFKDDEWLYRPGEDILPLVIHCYVDKEHLPVNEDISDVNSGAHGQVTLVSLERSGESSHYSARFLKQKQIIDGLPYLLEEMYGLEEFARSLNEGPCGDGNDCDEESTTDCVVCMSEIRDTLILPCRHMCLCSTCAESLRYQASACPICRAPFRALLQIRGLRRVIPINTSLSPMIAPQQQVPVFERTQIETNYPADPEMDGDNEDGPSQSPSTPNRELVLDSRSCCSPLPLKPAPPGYEAVPLMELLSTGWLFSVPPTRQNPFTMSPDGGSAPFLRNNSLRRSLEGDQCNVSIESGSLRSRSSKKKGNKRRNRTNPGSMASSADSAKVAAVMLSPRNIDLSLVGATGVSSLPDDCEVIELTPSSHSNVDEVVVEPPKPSESNEETNGFRSVELLAPGRKSSVTVDIDQLDGATEDAPMQTSPSTNGVSQSEEDSSLSSTTSGKALLGGKCK